LVAGGDDQIAALARERMGDGETDATIGAGNESESTGKHGFAGRGFTF
jgi:hypothetical protein